ncbi:Uncharacterised protein [Mycobacteroides abscessus subsp. massiliense]|nr:Uncharacterised protein [Mycobacteroides abscessus subsp. massiliense]
MCVHVPIDSGKTRDKLLLGAIQGRDLGVHRRKHRLRLPHKDREDEVRLIGPAAVHRHMRDTRTPCDLIDRRAPDTETEHGL